MKKYLLFAVFVLFAFFLNAELLFSESERREWTSNGVTVIGAWDPSRDTAEERITLESSDGKQLTLSLKDLSDEDRAYVEAKRKETGWEPMPDPGAQNIYALLVGVNDYGKYQGLNYAVRDIELLREQLVNMGVPPGHIRMLSSPNAENNFKFLPTKGNIEEELDRLFGVPSDTGGETSASLLKKGDLVFIALSGHGTQTPNGAYFMPVDASGDKSRIETTSISIDALQKRMSESKATFKWLVVDACRSDPPKLTEHIGERNSADFSLTRMQTIQNPPPGMIVMQSCSVNESSWESEDLRQGIFTSTLVEGLQGRADIDGDGSVTITELCGYVSDTTHRKVWEERRQTQTPYISNHLNNFVIVDGLLRDGLSREVWTEAEGYYQQACLFRRQRQYVKAQEEIRKALKLTEGATAGSAERQKYLDESEVIEGFQAKSEAERKAAAAEEARKKAEAEAARKLAEAERKLREAEERARVGGPVSPQPVSEEQTASTDTAAERVSKLGIGTTPGEKKTIKAKGIDYTFCWCPAGEFEMGSPDTEEGRDSDETQHRVTLTRGFWLLESEVTQEMWESVMGTTVRQQRDKANNDWSLAGVGPRYPMYYVDWDESQAFCRKLSSLTGEKAQLPTEAQWEYACRAGTRGAYGETGRLNEMGWYGDNSDGKTHEVKGKKPNAWGLYDMHGNVYEWCSDWYDDYPNGTVTDPTGPSSGSFRVFRGGSWLLNAGYCRSANRYDFSPSIRDYYLGFRLVVVSAD